MPMESLMRNIRRIAAAEIGCGDCTMMADWRTSSVQKPLKCKLNDMFVHCPITGEMPYDWELCDRKARYMFVESGDGGED